LSVFLWGKGELIDIRFSGYSWKSYIPDILKRFVKIPYFNSTKQSYFFPKWSSHFRFM